LLNPHNKDKLVTILEYHFHSGSVLSTELKDGEELSTQDGFQTLDIQVLDQSVFINYESAVVEPNLIATNGIVHVISGVLVPTNVDLPALRVLDLAKTVPSLSTLVKAVGAGVVVGSYLNGAGPLTVLAPSNEAFAALPAGELDYLLMHPVEMDAVLLYHITNLGRIYSENIKNGEKVKMIDDNDVVATISDGFIISFNSNSTVIAANVDAINGVVHVIDNVLIPPAVRAKMDAWFARH
jgi:transforming growth factor-beta-induced protein